MPPTHQALSVHPPHTILTNGPQHSHASNPLSKEEAKVYWKTEMWGTQKRRGQIRMYSLMSKSVLSQQAFRMLKV